jgi:hypothetical protein
MTPVENDVVRRLQLANPVADEDVTGSVEGPEARELLARVTTSPEQSARRPRNWLKVGVLAVSMAVVIALVAVSLVRGNGPAVVPERSPGIQATSGAPVILERIAAVAAMQPEVTLPEGGFRYTRSETRYTSTSIRSDGAFSVLESTIREIWVAPDGKGRLRTEVGDVEFLTPQDEAAWRAAGSPDLRRESVNDQRFPGGDPGGTDLYFETFEGLPFDPDDLYGEIERRSQNQGITLHQQMFDMVGSLLRETNASPEIRAALFRAAAKIPGVEVTENVTDPKGRPGIAMSLTYDPGGRRIRNELIFDPETSALLAEGQYAMEKSPNVAPTGRPDKLPEAGPTSAPVLDIYGDLAPGTKVGGAVYLEWGVVDSVEVRPSG